MYYIEENTRLKQILEVFHKLGMWEREEDSNNYCKKALKFWYLIFYALFVMAVLSGGIFSDNWYESVFLITVTVELLVVIIKLFYILWRKDEVCEFIQAIGTHSLENSEQYTKVNEKVKNLMKFSYWFIFIIFVCCVVLFTFCLPVFTNEKQFPFKIGFSLDWNNNAIAYWIVYSWQVIAGMIGVLAVFLNIIIWYLMMNCAIKYQILGNQFRTLFLSKPAIRNLKISKLEEENLFLQEIIRVIKAHRYIKESVDRFKLCFANLFLAQITTSGLCICGSVYMLTFGSDKEFFVLRIFSFAALFNSCFDIFMLTYLGNEIKLSSDRLSYCLFECNWIERSEACKKCMIILTEVLKQPHELVMGKLYPLNMETFTSVVNLAYSMFNILQNLK